MSGDEKRRLVRDGEADSGPYVPRYDGDGNEIVSDKGEDLPVVPMAPRSHGDFNSKQRAKVADIYMKIASYLPTEGRDYLVDFTFENGSDVPRIHLKAMTNIGVAFVKHIYDRMSEEMALQRAARESGSPSSETRNGKLVRKFDVPMESIPEPMRKRILAGEKVPLETRLLPKPTQEKNIK